MNNPLNQPTAPAPPGQHSNLIDPPSEAYLLIVTAVICLTCATPMVFTRIYVSIFVMKDFRWDDCLVFFSWMLFGAYCGIGLGFIQYGAMVDIWNVRLGDTMKWYRLVYAEELIYTVLITMIKLAVLILYKRVFVPARVRRNWVYITIVLVIVFNLIVYTASFFIRLFACTPISRVWNLSGPGKCLNVTVFVAVTAALNVLSDFFILFIPMAVVWKLHMPRKRKTEILCIFACGAFCFVSSIARLVYSILDTRDRNQTVALMKVAMWTVGEATSCFLASCVPMVPCFVVHIRRKYLHQQPQSSATSERIDRSTTVTDKTTDRHSTWSVISAVGVSRNSEEDPYLIMPETCMFAIPQDLPPGEEDEEQEACMDYDAQVTRTVSISAVPPAYAVEPYRERGF